MYHKNEMFAIKSNPIDDEVDNEILIGLSILNASIHSGYALNIIEVELDIIYKVCDPIMIFEYYLQY